MSLSQAITSGIVFPTARWRSGWWATGGVRCFCKEKADEQSSVEWTLSVVLSPPRGSCIEESCTIPVGRVFLANVDGLGADSGSKRPSGDAAVSSSPEEAGDPMLTISEVGRCSLFVVLPRASNTLSIILSTLLGSPVGEDLKCGGCEGTIIIPGVSECYVGSTPKYEQGGDTSTSGDDPDRLGRWLTRTGRWDANVFRGIHAGQALSKTTCDAHPGVVR